MDGRFAGRDRCRDCDTGDVALAYRSGRMNRCIDCQHYWNLTHRAAGGRKTVEMGYSREEFVALKRSTPRECGYCGIDGPGLWQLHVLSSTGRRIETIGWDRLDSDLGYVDGNWVPCCGACNQVKSNVFTAAEMRLLGPVVRAVLSARARPGLAVPLEEVAATARTLVAPPATDAA